jgi:hypothetical protein
LQRTAGPYRSAISGHRLISRHPLCW